jgi:outer membrane protein insertion porin family
MRVAKIDVIPENLAPEMAFNPGSVRARMHTKVGNYFSQTEFDNDLKMLAEEYDRVEPRIEVINNEIYITLQIWFKPKIHEIIFCGNDRFSSKKLLKTLDIEIGSLFEREAFIKGLNKIRQMYVKKGYFEVEVDYEMIPLETDNQIDIRVNINEGRGGRIKEICFKGLSPAEEKELLTIILTRKYNFCLSWLTNKGVYHPELIEHDRLQILNYFQNKGFADALVALHVEEIPDSDKIILVIEVDKGTCYTVGNLSFCGNALFPSETIREQLTLVTGNIYSPEDVRATVQAITDLYGASGYIDVNIDVQLALRVDAPIYDIAIKIEEGLQYYVGLVRVFGNYRTRSRVILHETIICPGELFNNRKLEATEERLANTGYFGAVNVYAVRSQIEDPTGERIYRDVYIEVEETDTGNFGLFGGFSSIDRIFGGIEITERNFNIAGIPLLFTRGPRHLRGGGEFAHAKINIGDRQTSYNLQWTKPYIFDSPWIFGVDLEKSNNRAVSRAYEIKTYGGDAHFTYVINPFLKYDTHYRARHTKVALRDKSNPLLLTEGNHGGFVSAAGFSFIYDSTDRPRRASKGLRSRLMYELAGIGGNYQFMKLAYLNTYYFPLSIKDTLKFRGEFQFIKTYAGTRPEDLPLSERLFLGGETTVRGYRNFIIGPKFGNNEPRGGLSSLLLSGEFQHNLLAAPCLDGFVFIDAGYVSFSEFTLGSPAASAGFGIRVEVMRNMPLMLGVGWPFHARRDEVQRFFFAVGGFF